MKLYVIIVLIIQNVLRLTLFHIILKYNDILKESMPLPIIIQFHCIPLPLECGSANQEIRIVGGRPTGVNQYPWIARLVYDGQFHCGASLLTQDYVLTAAHCVRRYEFILLNSNRNLNIIVINIV